MTMEHAITGEELMAFIDGELSGERLSVVGRHVGSCRECQPGGEQMRELSSILRAAAYTNVAAAAMSLLNVARWLRVLRI